MSTVKATLTKQVALELMLKCLFRGAKSNEDRSWITDLTVFFYASNFSSIPTTSLKVSSIQKLDIKKIKIKIKKNCSCN